MSIIEESLYRISGINLNEEFDKNELILNLINMFGDNFNEKPICSEVCNYIENRYPNLKKINCAVYIKEGKDSIIISTDHSVIKDEDVLLDFTNQQYNNYKEYGNNTDIPRIFNKIKNNIYVNGNMYLEI